MVPRDVTRQRKSREKEEETTEEEEAEGGEEKEDDDRWGKWREKKQKDWSQSEEKFVR